MAQNIQGSEISLKDICFLSSCRGLQETKDTL